MTDKDLRAENAEMKETLRTIKVFCTNNIHIPACQAVQIAINSLTVDLEEKN